MWVRVRVLESVVATVSATFERTLAVVREENSTLRRMLEAANARADKMADEMARQMVLGGWGPQARQPVGMPNVPFTPPRTTRDPIPGLGNLLDPVPFDDPRGTFKSEAEASLLFPSTNGDTASAEA